MLSVKYNGVELRDYIGVLDDFTPFTGVKFNNELNEDGIKCRSDFLYNTFKYKKIPMPFDISTGNIQEKYLGLMRALNSREPQMLIFGNVPNKYVMAIPDDDLDIKTEKNGIISGQISWLIPDGLIHSITMKEFTAEPNEDGILEAVIKNEGSVAVPIDFEITHNHENGYIGIVSEYGAMQYGSVSESDIAMSETLINAKSATEISYTSLTNTAYFKSNYTLNGSFRQLVKNNRTYLEYNAANPDGAYWHGAAGRITLPDWPSSGQKEIKNFKIALDLWFERTKGTQTGCFEISLTKGTAIVAAMQVWYNAKAGCNFAWFVGNYVSNHYSPVPVNLSAPGQEVSITKTGGEFQFQFGTMGAWIRADGAVSEDNGQLLPDMTDQAVDGINFCFTQQKGKGYNLMPWIAVDKLTVRVDTADEIIDVPNRYAEGSVFTIDGQSRKAYVNGTPALGDEVTGTKYFLAPPGETQVQYLYSDFSDPAPTCKARIREAWI